MHMVLCSNCGILKRMGDRCPSCHLPAKPKEDSSLGPVNQPAHYTTGKIECIDFIEDKKLDFHKGNAVKYITRAGIKDQDKEIEDLQKAVWYLNREIENLKKARGL